MKDIKIKITDKCISRCKCYFCKNSINKDERYLDIRKNAWRGTTRSNICRGVFN